MRVPRRGGPLLWCSRIVVGLYRSVVLVGLTLAVPVVGVLVGWGGSQFTRSWSADLTAGWVVQVLVTVGETLIVTLWVAAAVWITHLLTC
jgi:hypothetical protein